MGVVNRTFSEIITSTRASNATYFDSAGLLRTASSNVPRVDYDPSTLAVRGMLVEEQRTNLIQRSTQFDHANWVKGGLSISPNQEIAPDGSRSASVCTVSSLSHGLYIYVTVTASTSYTLSFYVKRGTATTAAYSITNDSAGGSNIIAPTSYFSQTSSSAWTRITVTFTTPVGCTMIGAFLNRDSGSNSGTMFFWGAQIEAGAFATSYIPSSVTFSGRTSNGTYFASDGLIRTASSGVSRTQYNPTNLAADPFLLLEESRTNSLAYSEYAENAAWGKLRSSVNSNVTTAPNGSMSADKMVEDTATGTHVLSINATGLTGGATYTQTVYVKEAGRTKVIVGGWDGTTGIDCLFNLSTGVVESVGAGAIASSIDSVGSGWYRCRVTRAIAAAATELSLVLYTHNGTSASYTGDGTSGLFIWGGQIELGAFPTSYIPSTVTFSGRTSSGTYFDSAGILQTATSGVARTTYNPANVGAEPFLLLEESRTNSIRNNTMVGAVAGTPGTVPTNWSVTSTGGSITRTIVGTGTENGITYIDIRYVFTEAALAYVIPQTTTEVAALNGQTWSASIYARVVAGSLTNLTATFGIDEYSSGFAWLAGSTASIVPTGAALSTQRFGHTRTLNNASTASIVSFMKLAATGAADITLRIGMPQLEQGAFSTSVISTTTAAATRAADTSTSSSATRAADTSTSAAATRSADVVSINTLSPWYNASEGTLFAQTIKRFTGNFVNYPHTAGLSDGTSSNRIWAGYGVDASQYITPDIATSGSSQLNYTVGLYSMTSVKNAIAYKNNDSQWAFNGTTSATDTLCTIPSNLNKLNIGSDNLGGQCWNGWICNIKYYPRRLTQAELITLTT